MPAAEGRSSCMNRRISGWAIRGTCLLVDLLGCLQWFNPAMWLLRVELRAVHEYEADEQVLRCGGQCERLSDAVDKKGRWREVVLNCQQP